MKFILPNGNRNCFFVVVVVEMTSLTFFPLFNLKRYKIGPAAMASGVSCLFL